MFVCKNFKIKIQSQVLYLEKRRMPSKILNYSTKLKNDLETKNCQKNVNLFKVDFLIFIQMYLNVFATTSKKIVKIMCIEIPALVIILLDR